MQVDLCVEDGDVDVECAARRKENLEELVDLVRRASKVDAAIRDIESFTNDLVGAAYTACGYLADGNGGWRPGPSVSSPDDKIAARAGLSRYTTAGEIVGDIFLPTSDWPDFGEPIRESLNPHRAYFGVDNPVQRQAIIQAFDRPGVWSDAICHVANAIHFIATEVADAEGIDHRIVIHGALMLVFETVNDSSIDGYVSELASVLVLRLVACSLAVRHAVAVRRAVSSNVDAAELIAQQRVAKAEARLADARCRLADLCAFVETGFVGGK